MHPYISGGWHAAVSYYSMAQCWLSTESPIIITQSLFVNEPRLHDNGLLSATDVGMHGLLLQSCYHFVLPLVGAH